MPFDPREQYITTRVPLAISPAPRDYAALQDARLINCYVEDDGGNEGLPYVSRRQGFSFVAASGVFNTHGIYYWQAANTTYINVDSELYNALTGGLFGTTTFTNTDYPASYAESNVPGSNLLVITTNINGYTVTTAGVIAQIVDPQFPGAIATLIPGIVYMDGYTFIATAEGQIYNSDLSNPMSWNGLGFISADAYPDPLVALTRNVDYIVAFGQVSTQFFYNAGNPAPASPLSPVPNSQFQIGCVAAASVCSTENTVIWLAQTPVHGVCVMQLTGFRPMKISNEYIDRMLTISTAASDMRKVTGYSVKMRGHVFYVLNHPSINKTFVYDLTTKHWAEWRSVAAPGAGKVATIALVPGSDNVLVDVPSGHGGATGSLFTMAGFLPAAYNITAPVYVIDSTHFTYPSGQYNNPITVAAGSVSIVAPDMFLGRYSASNQFTHYFAAKSAGQVYSHDYISQTDVDAGFMVPMSIITPPMEAGKLDQKAIYSLEAIGDKPLSTSGDIIPIFISWSDDDYKTWAPFRIVPQNRIRSRIRRLGAGRRRAFWIQYIATRQFRIQALELTIERGDT